MASPESGMILLVDLGFRFHCRARSRRARGRAGSRARPFHHCRRPGPPMYPCVPWPGSFFPGRFALMSWIVWVVFTGGNRLCIRREQRAGLWSWSKFAFTLGFAAVACALLLSASGLSQLEQPIFMAGLYRRVGRGGCALRRVHHQGAGLEAARRSHLARSLPR